MTLILDQNLREFATECQWKTLLAWEKHGSKRLAAEAMGVGTRVFTQARDRVFKKAALRGYSPNTPVYHGGVAVPKGFVLRGQSPLVDAHGKLVKRWDKTKQEGMDPDEAYSMPDPKTLTKLSTMTDSEGRVIVQWRAEKPEDIAKEHAWRAFAEELSRDTKRIEPTPPPAYVSEHLLAGYPVGDHHMGMLSWKHETGVSYDINIAAKLLRGAFSHLTQAAGPAKQALIVFLGDFLHYDSFESVTSSSRNQLDADSRFPKMAWAAVEVMRRSIDMALLAHGQVHVIVEPGNHDLSSSVFLALCLKIAYENEPRVTVDQSPMHYHYFRFGKVLLGTHHGHGTKMANLPLIMATDRPKDWGDTEYRYGWTGHIHQSKVSPAISAQDYSGCVVESFRILAPPDAWAHQKGYRSHRDMKAVVFHDQYGEVARYTVNPNMLRGVA